MSALKKEFAATGALFTDISGKPAEDANSYWAPVVITRAQIDAEIERLCSIPKPGNGWRQSLITHPMAPARAPGLAPGIQVRLSVLLPGESTQQFRHNATEVNFCIAGEGETRIGGKVIRHRQYDVWNHPSYSAYTHHNTSRKPVVKLTYSNAPLLQNLQVYLADEEPVSQEAGPVPDHARTDDPTRKSPFGTFAIGDEGGMLMPYETLINPVAAESKALHFPWEQVKAELDKLVALGKSYVGRRLYMMYNPLTTRFNGITPSFFATMTIRPGGIVDRPHRHVSAAINYYFKGRGFSMVAGNRYEWGPGDLMLSAPGWAVHNHASYEEQVYELTVQDQPLHIYMESLLWQEDLKHAPQLLGSRPGFSTNRDKLAA
ncbi:MAG TPA: AraC family ligand binding domain-containing protein [Ramlibacter sp.]|uniref:cupin domain-containing protein n=1 Tax=Ramlibacter sp. TaxID=1917967 RepID=UPI002C01B191|nr:AraC family ligand binding domain-containing protein [Ramlibacter sp.]HVZ46531.1 AraC family ligand binding domain-containing protein [Ramlibacter sp.]